MTLTLLSESLACADYCPNTAVSTKCGSQREIRLCCYRRLQQDQDAFRTFKVRMRQHAFHRHLICGAGVAPIHQGVSHASRLVSAQYLRDRGIAPHRQAAMSDMSRSAWRLLGAIGVAVLGVAFFFVIIGVFGLPASMIALVLFIALTLAISRRPQTERRQP